MTNYDLIKLNLIIISNTNLNTNKMSANSLSRTSDLNNDELKKLVQYLEVSMVRIKSDLPSSKSLVKIISSFKS